MFTNNFFKTNFLILIIANLANVFQYLYQFVTARGLNVEDYGVMNSVMSVSTLLGAFTIIIPFISSKIIIKNKGNLGEAVSRLLFLILAVALLFMTVLLALSGVLANYLKLDDITPVFILTAIFASMIIMNTFLGIISGLLKYVDASIKRSSAAFFKFAFAYLIVMILGFGYNGALLSLVLANAIVALWGYMTVRKYVKLKWVKIDRNFIGMIMEMLKYALPIGLSAFAFNFVSNIDIALVKNLLDSKSTGLYSVVSLLGKIAIFVPGVLVQVLYPQVSQEMKDGKSSIKSVLVIMGLTLFISVGYIITVSFFPEFIIKTLFGAKYIEGADVLTVIGMAMAIFAVVNVLFNFLLAKEKYTYLYISYACIGIMLLIIYSFLDGSMMQIATGILIGAIMLAVSNGILVVYYYVKTS